MSNHPTQWDVIIIGAGAAGLLAAISAGRRGRRVLVLEKNRKLGVKILMSGGTRCNITHHCDAAGIIDAFGRNGRFLHSPLAAFSPQDVVKLIEQAGVATKIESTGKIFPASDRAIDVRDALVRLATESGAVIQSDCAVSNLRKTEGGFEVVTSDRSVSTSSVIVTSGGQSYPGCGTTGDGYQWARELGHSIVPPFPALTPILSDAAWAHELKGITVPEVDVAVYQPPSAEGSRKRNKPIAQQRGSFLFTHWGMSGPSILDVSREVARHPNRKSLSLVCDFVPSYSSGQLESLLHQRRQSDGRQQVISLLGDLVPRRLAESLLTVAEIDEKLRGAELSNSILNRLIEWMKATRFPIKGTLGFEKAEVTSGGVNLKEINSKTMQSKLHPGLYFAGEILDLDGRIGGFNFQSAFSTGWLAGQWV